MGITKWHPQNIFHALYHYTGLALTNALWSALSVMATTFVGVLMFKEVLHVHDYIAIAMIGGGVMILKFTD